VRSTWKVRKNSGKRKRCNGKKKQQFVRKIATFTKTPLVVCMRQNYLQQFVPSPCMSIYLGLQHTMIR